MLSPESSDRLVLLAIGGLVLLGPVVILMATLGVLILLGDLAVGRITLVDFLELYIIDLLLFIVVGYGIYRLTLWLVEHRAPAKLDALEARAADASRDEPEPDDQ